MNYAPMVIRNIGGVEYVFQGSLDGCLYVFKPDGSLFWKFQTQGSIYSAPAVDFSGQVPTVSVGSSDGRIYCLNASTGRLIWSAVLGGPIMGSLAFMNGNLYVAANNGQLYALSEATGHILWQQNVGSYQIADPVLDQNNVYIATMQGTIFSIAEPTGSVNWTKNFTESFRYTPTLDSNALYVPAQSGSLYSLNLANGGTNWVKPVSSSYLTSPALYSVDQSGANGLIIGTGNGVLVALKNLSSPIVAWTHSIGGVFSASPVIAAGVCLMAGKADQNTGSALKALSLAD